MKIKLALQQEASGFIHYFKREAQCTNQYFIANHRIYFYHGENVILDYRQLGSKIIRQKNGEGYVIVCFDVKDFLLVTEQNGVLVKLVLERGEQLVEVSAFVERQVQKIG